MSETRSSVSVIIINYNTPELVTDLIASIRKHTAGISYDITVVDNGSRPERRFRDDTCDTAIRVIQSEANLGFATAANLGARNGHSTYLLFANSDCRLTANIIPLMSIYLDRNPDCAACGPQTVDEKGKVHSSIRLLPTYSNLRHSRASILGGGSDYTLVADSTRKPVEAMSATFMMVRRSIFEQVGGFDERYFMYVEDTDLCKRFQDLGKQVVYLGDLSVIHIWGASTRAKPWRMRFEHHRSMRYYFRKHFPKKQFANFLLTLQLMANFFLLAIKIALSRSVR